MVRSADVLIGYHTYPHVDENSTGARAATVLSRLLNTKKRPEVSAWKIPMVRNCDGSSTDRGILRDLWQKVVTTEQRDDVASIGLYPVQPWLDAPQLGWSFYQAYWGVSPPLDAEAVARECWATRDYSEAGGFLSPDKLVEASRAIEGGPVVVSEGYDATNSGAPGDSTHLLDALLTESPGKGGSLAFCVDPESVDCCTRSGVGAIVDLCLGGKRDPYSKPLFVRAQVKQLGGLSYRLSGHGGHNFPVDMGRMARITVRDVTVVLVEKTGPGSTPILYEVAGADPRSFKVVLAKSPSGFRNDYESFAAGIVFCSAPGAASPNLNHFDFIKTTRPLYPWDNLIDMEQASWAGLL
jgi:microcystin degradation protein MlrC